MVTNQTDLQQVQLTLENESLALGMERYREAVKRGEETMPPGMRLIKAAVEPLAAAIEQLVADTLNGKPTKNAGIIKFLNQFEPERAAFITARRVIHGITDRVLVQTLAIQIANSLEDCVNFDDLAAKEPKLYKQLIRKIEKSNDESRRHVILRAQQKYAGIDAIRWGLAEKVRLGTTLIHLMLTHTGLIEITRLVQGRNDTPQYVTATAVTIDWLEKAHGRCELMSPQYLPMVVPPTPWTGPFGGGYLTKPLRFPLIKTANRNYLEELKSWDMPMVYDAVNALQETAWSVNEAVLRVARESWDGGGRLGKLPPRFKLELPPQGYDAEADPEAHKAWKRAAAKVYEENVRLTSKRLAVEAKLHIAEKMSEHERIYFVHALDWRGRAYPVSSQLNPQGDDLAKALLEFADGMELGEEGANWLAVHGANCYGVDKVPFPDRIKWVEDHRDQILDCAFNPLDGSRFWCDASSPYMFLAFCFEWAGYLVQGPSYVSRLPVSWDGSCNGLQNFSAMLRDEIGGRATNLTPSEKPSDIYMAVCNVSQQIIDADAAAGHEVAPKWVGKMKRAWTKRNTMTVPYGVTESGMRDQLRKEFSKAREEGDLTAPEGDDAYHGAAYIATVNYTAIGQVVVAARQAMDWLRDTARVVASDGLPVRWVTPSGLPVQQGYRLTEGKRLDFEVSGKRYQLVLQVTGTKLDKRKQAAGISPNFVHSLDAAHMMRTTCYCVEDGIRSFAMIHDSYGAHAAVAGKLRHQLRRAFVDQYRGDVLRDFRDQLIAQIPEELVPEIPPLPQMGTLELEGVMHSEYFFA